MTTDLKADLVLSGGGVKGIGLAGATVALMEAGYAIQRVSGTSAGSVVGAILAAGADQLGPEQVEQITMTLPTANSSTRRRSPASRCSAPRGVC